MPNIHFLTDNNVPDALGRFLRERGHTVYLVRVELGEVGVDDDLIIATARQRRLVVVTWNIKHFENAAKRTRHERYRHERSWGLLSYKMPENEGVPRTEAMIATIEHEYDQCAALGDACMLLFMELRSLSVHIYR